MHHFSAKHQYQQLTDRTIALQSKYHAMGDIELQDQTNILRNLLASGRSVRSLLADAYAVVCEAATRVLGMSPYDNQIMGAVAMEYNNVVEMKTGEGKTLTAIMPMYLHGLTGPGNFLITANAYLANRDAEQMGKVYKWLGLTIMPGAVPEGHDDRERDRRAIYTADIVYTTHSQLGFDYLFDNLAESADEQFMQGLHFGLLDEADEVLLDSASTPLVIAGDERVQSNLYQIADSIIRLLTVDVDFKLNAKGTAVWFTPAGIENMEHLLGVDHLLGRDQVKLYRHLVLALKAHQLLKRDRDYMVAGAQVVLVDTGGGRQLHGMKLQAGLHQAIEAKEHVEVSVAQRSMASVTYQNMFRMFDQLAGMTGTAKTDAEEFREIYQMAVYTVPTHKPVIRDDQPDKLFITNRAKLNASIAAVKAAHAEGRPVLIETGSVSLSNLYSRMLLQERVPHNLLNAQSAAKEAKIVAMAGQRGAITVATSMAGRGTDIKLGAGVADLGGLLVLGTERMANPRIDNQLRGRSGRQGDPGASVFYTSLEDTVVQQSAPKWVAKFRAQHADRRKQQLTKRRYTRIIDQAQHAGMTQERSARFQTLQYGEVSRLQRDSVYAARNEIMASTNADAIVKRMMATGLTGALRTQPPKTRIQLLEFIYQNIDSNFDAHQLPTTATLRQVHHIVTALMAKQLERQRQLLPDQQQWLYFERVTILKAIDNGWIDQVDNLEMLKTVTSDRGLAQHNPIFEYQVEAQKSFQRMRQNICVDSIRNVLLSQLYRQPDGSITVEFP